MGNEEKGKWVLTSLDEMETKGHYSIDNNLENGNAPVHDSDLTMKAMECNIRRYQDGK